MAQARRAYPRKVEIARAVEAARSAGISIGGVEVSADGTIRIVSAQTSVDSAYDRGEFISSICADLSELPLLEPSQ